MSVIGNKNIVKGITIQVKDNNTNKSKSFTIYGLKFQALFFKVLFYVKQLVEYDEIKLICYKKGDKNSKKKSK